MELNLTINLTKADWHEYQIFRLYSSSAALLGTVAGCWAFLLFLNGRKIGYLAVAIVLIGIFPLYARWNSNKQAEKLKLPSTRSIRLNENGMVITGKENGTEQHVAWNQVQKAFSTRKSIAVTIKDAEPLIFPRQQMQDELTDLVEILSTHLRPDQVKIRGAI